LLYVDVPNEIIAKVSLHRKEKKDAREAREKKAKDNAEALRALRFAEESTSLPSSG
jgi:hypothetical protein